MLKLLRRTIGRYDSPLDECRALCSRLRYADTLKGLDQPRLRRLLELLPALDKGSVIGLHRWSEQHTHPVLPLYNFASRFGAEIDERQFAALRKLVGFIGFKGCRVPATELAGLEEAAKALSREEIAVLFRDDPWVDNFATSVWEFAHGASELASYPWNVSLPIADLCNARCTFCTSWLDGRAIVKLEQIDALQEVIKRAIFLGLVGHGEPMAHPQFAEICDKLASLLDRRASCYTITNGYFLEKWQDRLDRMHLDSYSISLNAASAATHDVVMGLGPTAFDRIVASIRHLVRLRESTNPKLQIHTTMVVTQQNMHEVAGFVELGNELRVNGIWLRSLLPQPGLIPGLNYHTLSPKLHPDFPRLKQNALAAIQASKVPVQADPGTWEIDLFAPHLLERIAADPPPIVTREAAEKDKKLRHRNEYLYEARFRSLRGARKDPGRSSVVTWRDGELHLRTPAAAGAYAISVPLRVPSQANLGGSVTIEAACIDGELGFGLLNTETNEWIDRGSIGPQETKALRLSFPSGVRQCEVIVDNRSALGTPSAGLLRSVTAQLGDAAGEPGDRISAWPDFRVHNPLDPHDDGLNPLAREPRFGCKAVYYNLYINEMFFRLNPCCYMQEVPGFDEVRFDGSYPFPAAWNSPGMVALRTHLRDGPLFGACKRCPEKW